MSEIFELETLLEILRVVLLETKPNPFNDFRDADFALAGLIAERGRLNARSKLPSLVPGRLPPLLALRLELELGLGGGPIGLSTGEKKLDRLLSLGVDGRFCKLSIVRSLREGREGFFSLEECRGSVA